MRKQKRRGMSIKVKKRFEELLKAEYSVPQIYDQLVKEFGEPDETDGMVSDRTIRQYVKAARPPDPSGAWSFAGESENAAFVLGVLGAVVDRTEGRISQVTNRQAEWLVRIKWAVPDMPPWAAFWFARAYVFTENENQDTAHLDMALALTLDAAADRELGKARIARHIDLHRKLWPDREIIIWARETWIADEYEEAAMSRGAMLVLRDETVVIPSARIVIRDFCEGGGEVLDIFF